MKDYAWLPALLSRLAHLSVAVVGDFFLDRYYFIDPAREEISLETSLPAHQVVAVRSDPGAAGTVVNNLRALGVGRVICVGLIGQDGHGHDLLAGLRQVGAEVSHLVPVPGWLTPTYIKPLVQHPDGRLQELSRLDVRLRTPLSEGHKAQVADAVRAVIPQVDAVAVVDQMPEDEAGTVTSPVRETLVALAPPQCTVVDSRHRIHRFSRLLLKPNLREARGALAAAERPPAELAASLGRQQGATVVLTAAEQGAYVWDGARVEHVPAVPVSGPVDPVGAGDSFSAGLVAALGAGATLHQAVRLATLVASITVQKLGTTGTATPAEVLAQAETLSR